jgi:hypothetical protein
MFFQVCIHYFKVRRVIHPHSLPFR